jgi:hypothetical protein
MKMTLYAGLIAALLNPFNPLVSPVAAVIASLGLMLACGRGGRLHRIVDGALADALGDALFVDCLGGSIGLHGRGRDGGSR